MDNSLGSIIQPMPGLIVVLIDTKDEITPAGLFVPQNTARSLHEGNRPTHGTVIAVAIDSDDDLDDDLKIGDHILFGKFTGTRVDRMITEQDVTGRSRSRTEESIVVMYRKDVLAIIKDPGQAVNLKIKS